MAKEESGGKFPPLFFIKDEKREKEKEEKMKKN